MGTSDRQRDFAEIIEPYAKLVSEQNTQTNNRLRDLTESINELAQAHIRTEQIHTENKERFRGISKRLEGHDDKITEQEKKISAHETRVTVLESGQEANAKPREWAEKVVFIAIAIFMSTFLATMLGSN